MSNSSIRTLSLLVRNQPGVLIRVALVFSRRGYNIESLVVSPAKQDGLSRMTITSTSHQNTSFEQIIKQLRKLIDVVHATDHTEDDLIESEVALVKVRASLDKRTTVLQIAEHFKAKVVDFASEAIVLRLHGDSEKLNAAIELLREFEVIEMVRSGKLVMARGNDAT